MTSSSLSKPEAGVPALEKKEGERNMASMIYSLGSEIWRLLSLVGFGFLVWVCYVATLVVLFLVEEALSNKTINLVLLVVPVLEGITGFLLVFLITSDLVYGFLYGAIGLTPVALAYHLLNIKEGFDVPGIPV